MAKVVNVCGATLWLAPGFYVTCVMTGHTKPNTLGPTHMARTKSMDGRRDVVIRWPTLEQVEGEEVEDGEDEGEAPPV